MRVCVRVCACVCVRVCVCVCVCVHGEHVVRPNITFPTPHTDTPLCPSHTHTRTSESFLDGPTSTIGLITGACLYTATLSLPIAPSPLS